MSVGCRRRFLPGWFQHIDWRERRGPGQSGAGIDFSHFPGLVLINPNKYLSAGKIQIEYKVSAG